MPRRRKAVVRPRKTDRRWHIPPPLIHGPEALEGGVVLQEVPGEIGVVLWQVLRDVMLWAQTPPAERGELFSAGAHRGRLALISSVVSDAEIEPRLRLLAATTAPDGAVTAEEVAGACRAVSLWAEEQGRYSTALFFAQNAALARPDDPAAAFNVGRVARTMADHARAEVWYRRSLGLARQSRDWRLYSHAFLGLGQLAKERGNYPAARYQWMRALRGGRRGGLRQVQAIALHNLCVVAIETGRAEEADRLATSALEAYKPDHPRVPMLAHDVAYGWMERGYFARALPIFQALLPFFSQPLEGLFAWADIARAAAGSGRRDLFEEARQEVESRLREPAALEGEARALLELAYGAAHLGEWEQAGDQARRALAAATRRCEGRVRLAAEALLEQVSRGEQLAVRAAEGERDAVDPGDGLASDLLRRLEALTGAAV